MVGYLVIIVLYWPGETSLRADAYRRRQSPVRQRQRRAAHYDVLPAAPVLPRRERQAAQGNPGEFVRPAGERDFRAAAGAERRETGRRGIRVRYRKVRPARGCRRGAHYGEPAGPALAAWAAVPLPGYRLCADLVTGGAAGVETVDCPVVVRGRYQPGIRSRD